jgi:hypothetical protein
MASRNRTGQQRRVSDPLGLKERQTDYLKGDILYDHLQHPKIVEELKTELDFSSWYQGVEDGLLEASYEEYQ